MVRKEISSGIEEIAEQHTGRKPVLNHYLLDNTRHITGIFFFYSTLFSCAVVFSSQSEYLYNM